jgi:hypothetical protein
LDKESKRMQRWNAMEAGRAEEAAREEMKIFTIPVSIPALY